MFLNKCSAFVTSAAAEENAALALGESSLLLGGMLIQRLAIVTNLTKPGAAALSEELAAVARERGVAVAVLTDFPLAATALEGFDACAVLGGDGTLLGAVRPAVRAQVPLFGINRGKLGFLANYSSENAKESLSEVLAGEFQTVRRALLECRTGEGHHALALNDVVLKAADPSRLVRLRVFSQQAGLINVYRGDGLILCTPTGSTAYNLGAGGPLLDPVAEVFALTPICPHTLSNRSVILPRGTVIEIEEEERHEALSLAVDGGTFLATCTSFPVQVRVAEETLPLLQPKGLSHYELLRTKLRWA